MTTGKTGIDMIKSFEGCRLEAYKDPIGVYTIGYGHTKGVSAGMVITEDQAEAYLREDLRTAELTVDGWAEAYHWTAEEFDALVSFTFNCGAGNFIKLIRSGQRSKDEIAEAMLLYTKAGGKELAGLVRRRKAERELFLSGGLYECFPAYEGRSPYIDVVMVAIGADDYYNQSAGANWKKRIPIALANGIQNYTGAYHQNIELITLAKEGRLKKPC